MPRFLALVSERADQELRREVAEGRRPCPEYLRLERDHGFELLDWSRVGRGRRRTPALAVRHALIAASRAFDYDAILSDGEHVGVPLAVALAPRRRRPRHVLIGHHLTTARKRLIAGLAQAAGTLVLVHSSRQLEILRDRYGFDARALARVDYGVDTAFWSPDEDRAESRLVVAAGREHRDYATLATALEGLSVQAFAAVGSRFSPATPHTPVPAASQVQTGSADLPGLRDWYRRATLVVVPLLPNDFQAGVTTILEAMASGRPLVVSATEGQRDVIEDGVTGMLVPPADPAALREAVRSLLGDPAHRLRLGRRAREAAVERFDVDRYAAALAGYAAATLPAAAIEA
jgi:glycosyl transferase family 1